MKPTSKPDGLDVLKTVLPQRVGVRVTPKTARSVIESVACDDGVWSMRAKLRSAPEDGKANAELVELLSDALDIPKSRISIVRGDTSRNKIVAIG